ncbi:ScpA family protein [Arthrobacter sp. JSM 101049]|uniref:segregation and condensation protein A n=1 Tax=Arthrobacter sp. JSM 101049 TaxID=929097 RepID=UPI003564F60F
MTATGQADTASPSVAPETEPAGGFAVSLENFSGPFDVLLNLIGKHQLDITEVALAQVTDEFIGYLRELRLNAGERALEETTSFLVVASTLLDLKAARLLPTGEVESDEDIALLEARDLLFARLLQYRAFKAIAGQLSERLAEQGERHPRRVAVEPGIAALLPELVFTTTPGKLAELARGALEPKPSEPAGVGVEHLHAPTVSVREQAGIIAARLEDGSSVSFTDLVADAGETMVVIARFLALLEMFRDKYVGFDQDGPLGELLVAWNDDAGPWHPDRVAEEYQGEPAAGAAGNDVQEEGP